MKVVGDHIITNNKLIHTIIEHVATAMKAGNSEKGQLSITDCLASSKDYINQENLSELISNIAATCMKAGFVTGVNLTCQGRKSRARKLFRQYFDVPDADIEQMIGDKQQLKEMGL